jgi:hypothetical protein
MQGGKNWILPKVINANRFFRDFHWLEICKKHFCPSMGPNVGSLAMDSGKWDSWTHRVGRVLSFFLQPSELGLPHPPPAGECAPHPLVQGGGHTRLRKRGWEWGSPNSDEGTYTVVLCLYKYFVVGQHNCNTYLRLLFIHCTAVV